MAISCVVEYPEDYCHERFYGINPAKRHVSMGYQGRSPWLVSTDRRSSHRRFSQRWIRGLAFRDGLLFVHCILGFAFVPLIFVPLIMSLFQNADAI
jgi:hypothetical protein